MNNLSINPELQNYIEHEIFPVYEKNEGVHGLEHIKYVISRSLKFAYQFENINIESQQKSIVFKTQATHFSLQTPDNENENSATKNNTFLLA